MITSSVDHPAHQGLVERFECMAHNATDWLTSSYEKQGHKMTGGIDADSAKKALRAYREPKRHRVMLENVSSWQLDEMLTFTRPKTVG